MTEPGLWCAYCQGEYGEHTDQCERPKSPAPPAAEPDAAREAVAAALVTLANCNPQDARVRTLIGIPPDELAALRTVYKDYLRLRSAPDDVKGGE